MKEDLAKLDVFAAGVALHGMRGLHGEVRSKLHVCHVELQRVVQAFSCVVSRSHHSSNNDVGLDEALMDVNLHDLSSLSPETEQALVKLTAWGGRGLSPSSARPLSVARGQGTVKVKSGEVKGEKTDFRKQLQSGDLLIVEEPYWDNTEMNWRVREHTLKVRAMLAPTLVKVTSDDLNLDHDMTYYIARMDGSTAQDSADDIDSSLAHRTQYNFTLDQGIEPQVNAQIMEWDIHTRMQHAHMVGILQEENTLLSDEYEDLKKELAYMVDIMLVRHVFHLFKHAAHTRIQYTTAELWERDLQDVGQKTEEAKQKEQADYDASKSPADAAKDENGKADDDHANGDGDNGLAEGAQDAAEALGNVGDAVGGALTGMGADLVGGDGKLDADDVTRLASQALDVGDADAKMKEAAEEAQKEAEEAEKKVQEAAAEAERELEQVTGALGMGQIGGLLGGQNQGFAAGGLFGGVQRPTPAPVPQPGGPAGGGTAADVKKM
eukprot:gnl/TRDRNA2_/TRDRNA2_170505_c4_seq5.p1 gnl/TRDRNA2_/TRDRNA2_170505_c4~~gnl/TRDRNA2_/TRDRNA2_170505_c4_seq5.p1  ORF type:complete len:493 (+),score=129.70 gnl/TRDRNA2_/TRDRNA2_170505_c4_seq5:1-1479(+)